MIKYILTDDDLQLLYPLCRLEEIERLFPEHAPKEWTIRRRYRRLGLAPINTAHKQMMTALLSAREENVTREDWDAACIETVRELLTNQTEKIWEKIRTVESRSID